MTLIHEISVEDCYSPKRNPETRVTREMALDAGDKNLEGEVYSKESFERCRSCFSCIANKLLAEHEKLTEEDR